MAKLGSSRAVIRGSPIPNTKPLADETPPNRIDTAHYTDVVTSLIKTTIVDVFRAEVPNSKDQLRQRLEKSVNNIMASLYT